MRRWQYRELCRFCITRHFHLDLQEVRTHIFRSPLRCDQRQYKYQIDLVWVVENHLARYLHIAGCCWRERGAIKLEDILLLQKCKEKTGAHKAMFFTNFGYTENATLAAQDEGIDLFALFPLFDHRAFWQIVSVSDYHLKLRKLSRRRSRLYELQAVRLETSLSQRTHRKRRTRRET